MKLSKQQARDHATARALVEADRTLTEDEAEFVLDHGQEAATARNALDGAFFTPADLGTDLAVEVDGHRVIDLCAGIGRLAWSWRNLARTRGRYQVVCVERNPLYIEVGRKVLPEAQWICADIFHLPADLGTFDIAMSNPPYGNTERAGTAPRYTGRRFEYHAIDIAADLAPHGVFLIPQESAPFRDSGHPGFTRGTRRRMPAVRAPDRHPAQEQLRHRHLRIHQPVARRRPAYRSRARRLHQPAASAFQPKPGECADGAAGTAPRPGRSRPARAGAGRHAVLTPQHGPRHVPTHRG